MNEAFPDIECVLLPHNSKRAAAVDCLTYPMNGAVRRVERGLRTLEEELSVRPPLPLRACVLEVCGLGLGFRVVEGGLGLMV
jgi:hypothetical protein